MKITSVGFTGTQGGMTGKQTFKLFSVLIEMKPEWVIHGDCVGADSEFHSLAEQLVNPVNIRIFPPTDSKKRAWRNTSQLSLVIELCKPYLDRNKDIVDACDVLVACPFSSVEELRSGTWSTVRYARKKGKPVILIYPNGVVNDEQGVLK